MGKRMRKSEIPPIVKELGIRILEIIRDKGLKPREVAHNADLDIENLRKYIKGSQEMKISTMVKIADSLNVTVIELFTFPESKY
ncbi:MAG: helix-turn-helix transcriptional regulator [Saprospiraceae bacterium]|jgi:transcriptional regulator with XRE-family HTH domain|uniref:helix-turn-helix domain-containing protein n=1 Tax=Candidatus Brachybacter algidus TaxID=2982024 RepID=UPI001EB53B4F|nr:helix-turn-helix transcriptional regulator [Candidatus Brachybacter algidus]MBK7602273.1 helix-turn-helix transcriptional regulator [Candidatus Brachybacter algidus]MBK8356050.1 helix-turn-helix transcriptional regulator [Candidatus Brachybacter algidus]MBK8747439.1 helix-turn-helix transcriptional regulator [Candidatus Brachybacter algidus]MBK9025623.1 helix-turn-helix transcriptional regulator [Candidatus Brachybacter algidus]MBL0117530.1 helix-turn-helix transcriptional regulator [Candid